MPNVTISCPVFPSENPDKVRLAIEKIFPDAEISENEDGFTASADSLNHFSKQIRKQKILDTTRSVMIRGKRGKSDKTIFNLNKQVAFMGKISFCEEKMILGTIRVTIVDEEMDALIDTVAPETVDGEEVLI